MAFTVKGELRTKVGVHNMVVENDEEEARKRTLYILPPVLHMC